jgi:NAD(P)-dependent dehydrogenase (short-subunit alcohol dehydrogenase family)
MSTAGTEIEGAAALVTGGNRGFGRALVNELLARGAAKVYATSRLPHPTREERIVPLVLDVTDDESVAAAANDAPDVSTVVNNAGLSLRTSVLDRRSRTSVASSRRTSSGRSASRGHLRPCWRATTRAR